MEVLDKIAPIKKLRNKKKYKSFIKHENKKLIKERDKLLKTPEI